MKDTHKKRDDGFFVNASFLDSANFLLPPELLSSVLSRATDSRPCGSAGGVSGIAFDTRRLFDV